MKKTFWLIPVLAFMSVVLLADARAEISSAKVINIMGEAKYLKDSSIVPDNSPARTKLTYRLEKTFGWRARAEERLSPLSTRVAISEITICKVWEETCAFKIFNAWTIGTFALIKVANCRENKTISLDETRLRMEILSMNPTLCTGNTLITIKPCDDKVSAAIASF